MDNEMKKVDEYLENGISYVAAFVLEKLPEGESKSILDFFASGECIETSRGFVWGFGTGGSNYNKEQNVIFAEVVVLEYTHVATVLQELLEKAGVKSRIEIPGRAHDFSMMSHYEFADGKLVKSDSRNFYDNGVLYSGEETFIETSAKKFGVDLDKMTYDDPEVFAAFMDQEITKWAFCYFSDNPDENPMAILKPRSLDDLMVYYAAVMRNDGNDGMDAVKEYVARRDGIKPVPQSLPEDLKKTFGLVFFSEQESLAPSTEWAVPLLMPTLVARLNSESTYKFVYLCAKYGVHKDLK